MNTYEKYHSKISGFYFRFKRMPSYSELVKILGIKSKNGAYKIINKLIEAGFVERDKKGKIIPKFTADEIPMVGTVQAGFPSPAEEELVDTISLNEFLIERPEATHLMRVTGNSMTEAGIFPGDIVLVERNKTPKIGDIVIAEVDGEWTMKYFTKKNGQIILMPGNKNFKPIIAKQSLKVAAVVKAVIRKY